MPIKQHKGVVRPFGGRKNKAARNRALRDAQTVSNVIIIIIIHVHVYIGEHWSAYHIMHVLSIFLLVHVHVHVQYVYMYM